jgi:secretion/DNA translocation related TadE-like protein
VRSASWCGARPWSARARRVLRPDSGAGSVLLVAVVAVVLSAATAALVLGGALVSRQRAEAAADLAALAGAQALLRGGDACGAAGRVAAAGRARVVVCEPAGSTLHLVVEVALPGVLGRLDVPPARARARAGVPPYSADGACVQTWRC